MTNKNAMVNVGLLMLVPLMGAGCAVPTMNMKHEAAVGVTYPTKGKLQVEKFNDSRASNEKVVHQTAVNNITPQIWSGNTSPEMMEFFQSTLEQEATQAKLFTLGPGEYTLSGTVKSLKVDRTCTIFRCLLMVAFDFPKLEANIAYRAILSLNGQPVLTKEITHTKSSRYWAMTEMSWTQVSNKARRVLDEAITESIKVLFDEIDQKVK